MLDERVPVIEDEGLVDCVDGVDAGEGADGVDAGVGVDGEVG